MTALMHAIALMKLRACRVLWPEYQPRVRKPRQPLASRTSTAPDPMEAIVIGERFSAVMHAAISANGGVELDEAINFIDAAIALVELARKHERGIAMTQEERAIAIAVQHVIQHYVEA